MICRNCIFHRRSGFWNRCDLCEVENYYEYVNDDCPLIDDDYIFKGNCEPLGFKQGTSAVKFMKGGSKE